MFIIQESKRLAKSELKLANWKLGFQFSSIIFIYVSSFMLSSVIYEIQYKFIEYQ